jgi:hypothetical protein
MRAKSLYAPKEALIWWVDYLHSASEDAIRNSLERFKAIGDRLSHVVGATVDGWEGAQNALRAAFPGITLEECHFHALLKLGKHLATYRRQRKQAGKPVSDTEEANIREAFTKVLKAPTPEAYQEALDELPDAFKHPTMASRKQSLVEKQALFQAWTTDDNLAVVSTALDQCMYEVLEAQVSEHADLSWRRERLGNRKRLGDYTQLLAFSQKGDTRRSITSRIGWR